VRCCPSGLRFKLRLLEHNFFPCMCLWGTKPLTTAPQNCGCHPLPLPPQQTLLPTTSTFHHHHHTHTDARTHLCTIGTTPGDLHPATAAAVSGACANPESADMAGAAAASRADERSAAAGARTVRFAAGIEPAAGCLAACAIEPAGSGGGGGQCGRDRGCAASGCGCGWRMRGEAFGAWEHARNAPETRILEKSRDAPLSIR